MKKTGMLILAALMLSFPGLAGEISPECTYNGIPLYGRVKVVKTLADFKVKRVNALADLNVKKVSFSPLACGEWQFVESFPDFTIQYVDSFPDFTIKITNAFPGLP